MYYKNCKIFNGIKFITLIFFILSLRFGLALTQDQQRGRLVVSFSQAVPIVHKSRHTTYSSRGVVSLPSIDVSQSGSSSVGHFPAPLNVDMLRQVRDCELHDDGSFPAQGVVFLPSIDVSQSGSSSGGRRSRHLESKVFFESIYLAQEESKQRQCIVSIESKIIKDLYDDYSGQEEV